jgi:hypothetical protein
LSFAGCILIDITVLMVVLALAFSPRIVYSLINNYASGSHIDLPSGLTNTYLDSLPHILYVTGTVCILTKTIIFLAGTAQNSYISASLPQIGTAKQVENRT